MQAVMETYKRLGISPTGGRGSWLFDDEGNRYLDFIGGIATNSLGHGHPALVGAIKDQADRLIHCSNLYEIPIQAEAAAQLTQATDFDRVFFCNSGTESVEAAIKLARKHAHDHHGPEKHEVLTFSKSFHGRTYGALSATAQPSLKAAFGPMLPGMVHAPYGDLEAAEKLSGPQTAAILVEPIQGEGGVNVAPEGFLQGLRDLCDRLDAVLIFDEVQTGAGRTGHLYAYQGVGLVPDVLTSAKGLGGGFPVGAVLAKEEFAALGPGNHGSTFGGNPLAMAAIKAVLGVVNDEDFLAEVRFKGRILKNALETLADRVPGAEVRGEGLLIGFDFGDPDLARSVFEHCLEEGVLVNLVGGTTIRMAPPLTVTRTEVRAMLDTFRGGVRAAMSAAVPEAAVA
ncbi:acetylornithine/succinylornithine family transaminase [Rubrobacter tropicus]|uniref:Acetylornithine aminotransferase n=1 Tax=Rubrobacter tropicus TaxID=2653851 RepID=A0A6G8QBZ4_9ACTN|nr:aspartate aminotransferase family protein [Rubrobacter tropicus]QIN84006.1 acetylornithine/succinylornithine family transaminase [Rubrobacter tropicus]